MNTDSKKLAGKVAVVTGASKGIGAGIATRLADEGAAVVVNYASSKTGADKVVDEIKGAGGRAIAVQADMAQQADVMRLFGETKKAFGTLDILVNNAGIYGFAPLEDVTEDYFHKQFNLNVLGLLLACQAAARLFGSGGETLSTLVQSSALSLFRTPPFTAARKEPSTRSLARWRRNLASAASA